MVALFREQPPGDGQGDDPCVGDLVEGKARRIGSEQDGQLVDATKNTQGSPWG